MASDGEPEGRVTAIFRSWEPGTPEPGRGFVDLWNRLSQLSRGADPPPALLVADVDAFGEVADALEPLRTIEVLDEVAARLSGVVRGRDLFAHLGWDTFCVLMGGRPQPQGLEEAGRRMLEVVAAPILVPEGMVNLTACVAIVLADSQDDVWSLLAKADQSMDLAKANGPGSLVRYRS